MTFIVHEPDRVESKVEVVHKSHVFSIRFTLVKLLLYTPKNDAIASSALRSPELSDASHLQPHLLSFQSSGRRY
jgi:hypothetical protein